MQNNSHPGGVPETMLYILWPNYAVLNACMYLIIEWKWNGMRAWTLDFHFMSLALFWIRMFLMFQVFLCILYTLFVKILPRTNFCTPSIKVQNSVLIFAISRKFLAKTTFLYCFFQDIKFGKLQNFKTSKFRYWFSRIFTQIEVLRENVQKFARANISTNKVGCGKYYYYN